MVDGTQPASVAGGDAGRDDDLDRLETLLRERALEVRALRAEASRREQLLREWLSRADAMTAAPAADADGGGDGAELQALRAQLQAARARAVEAEVARAEAVFALDEARGGTDAGAVLAAAEGTAAGLRAALAEQGEARDTLEARLILAEHDREDALERARAFERDLQQAREQLELELARAAAEQRAAVQQLELQLEQSRSQSGQLAAPSAEADDELEELRGRCAGLSLRLADAEQALKLARGAPSGTGAGTGGAADRVTELQASLASVTEVLRAQEKDAAVLRAEREQLREHLEDFESAEGSRRGALQAAAEVAEAAYQGALDRLSGVRQGLAETRVSLSRFSEAVSGLTSDAIRSPVTGGLATVPGDVDSPVEDAGDAAPSAEAGLREQLRVAVERLEHLAAQRTSEAESHGASLASHRAQIELSRADAAGVRADLAQAQTRIDALRGALRAIRGLAEPGTPLADRLDEADRLLG